MTNNLLKNSLNLVIPGSVVVRNNCAKKGFNEIVRSDGDSYYTWKAASQMWVLYQIDSMTFPVKDVCKVEVRIYYEGKSPDVKKCIESIEDCFQGILWFDKKQIASSCASKMMEDIAYPRIELVFHW